MWKSPSRKSKTGHHFIIVGKTMEDLRLDNILIYLIRPSGWLEAKLTLVGLFVGLLMWLLKLVCVHGFEPTLLYICRKMLASEGLFNTDTLHVPSCMCEVTLG